MTLAGLPLHMVDKPHHMHLISCSNNVSALDLSAPIVEDLLKLEDGMYMHDASMEEQVLVFTPVLSILCDNPRASELLNHLGSSAKKFCRLCLVNFLIVQYIVCIIIQPFLVQSDKSNSAQVGQPRSKEQAIQQMAEITSQPNEAAKNATRREYGLKERPNPLFRLSVDLFRYDLTHKYPHFSFFVINPL